MSLTHRKLSVNIPHQPLQLFQVVGVDVLIFDHAHR